jgi:hypothetical protein
MTSIRFPLLLAVILVAGVSQSSAQTQVDLPVTFEDGGVTYTLADFDGTSSALGPDPANAANTVAITTKASAAAPWAGTTIGGALGFATAIPLTASDTQMSVLVFSPAAGIQVRLKAEDRTDVTLTVETEATTSVANLWEKLTFDFSQPATGTNPFNPGTTFDKLTIFFNFGVEGAGGVYYWDDVRFGAGVQAEVSLSDLLVDDSSLPDFSPTIFSYSYEVEEGVTTIPVVTGVATDAAGATVDVTPATAIPGTAGVVVTGSDGVTRSAYTVAFAYPPPVFPPLSLPIDFEAGPYGFVDFDGGAATVIENPQSGGLNTSATVAQIVRSEGAIWAGSKLLLENKLDFTVNNALSMMVYSPRAEMPVLFKLEGPGVATQVLSHTTKANEWELMTWDFTETASGAFEYLVFMFDFESLGDGTANSTFLFDDVTQFDNAGGLSRIDLPVDFESSTVNYTLTDFGGAETELGADPTDATNTVAVTTKVTGAADWAGTTVGTNFGFASRIPLTAAATTMSVNVYSPLAGLPVRLKAEFHNDPTLTVETEATTTVANAWEVLVFDFSSVATGTNPFNPATTFDMLSIFFNFGTGGANGVYYWDRVTFGTRLSVGVEELDPTIPHSAAITGSYPSPFVDASTILYSLDRAGLVDVSVYTIQGKKLETLFSGPAAAGDHTAVWKPEGVAAGVYFVRMESNSGRSTRKLVLVR